MTTHPDPVSLRRGFTLSRLFLSLAAFALLSFSSPVSAAEIDPPVEFPGFGIRINEHGQGPPIDIMPPGLENARNRFKGGASQNPNAPNGGRWKVEWDIEVDPDPFIIADMIVTNNTNQAKDFTFNLVLETSGPITGGTLIGGSFGALLNDRSADEATLSVISGVNPPPLYTALIDGEVVHTLFDDPASFSVSMPFETLVIGPETFGTPIPSLLGPETANATIGIDISVRVSANDSVNLSGVFVVVPIPEPSTMVLCVLGALGLLASSRRRRSR